jgi:hypothetical protein
VTQRETNDDIFATVESTEKALLLVDKLIEGGVSPDDLSVLMKADNPPPDEVQHMMNEEHAGVTLISAKDAEHDSTGSAMGIGPAATMAALPLIGFGLVAGAGGLATALFAVVGATGAAAMAGVVTNTLISKGIEPEHINAIHNGEALVGVTCPVDEKHALTIKSTILKHGGKLLASKPIPTREED